MSTFKRLTIHPETGLVENATWVDDFFGQHNYGVAFRDGRVFKPSQVKFPPEVIVAAANRHEDGTVVVGVRHFDDFMHGIIQQLDKDHKWEQGFVTSTYRFVDREEAWKIAENAKQIVHYCSTPGTLFSENLY